MENEITEDSRSDQDSWVYVTQEDGSSPRHTPGEEDSDNFSGSDETHSDTGTHRTDDLFPRGELDDSSGEYRLPSVPEDLYINNDALEEHTGPWAITVARLTAVTRSGIRAADRLFATLAQRLHALVLRVGTMMAQHKPVVHEMLSWIHVRITALIRSVQVHIISGSKPMYAGIRVTAHGTCCAATTQMRRLCEQAARASRSSKLSLAHKIHGIDWIQASLTLGCSVLAAMLYRSCSVNAQLTAKIDQREGELVQLVARIIALQRSVAWHRMPIVRHSAACLAAGGGMSYGGWPVFLQAI